MVSEEDEKAKGDKLHIHQQHDLLPFDRKRHSGRGWRKGRVGVVAYHVENNRIRVSTIICLGVGHRKVDMCV